MASGDETVTLRLRALDRELLADFAPVERFNVDARPLAETLAGCDFVQVEAGGEPVAVVAVTRSGRVCELVAGASLDNRRRVLRYLPAVEAALTAPVVELRTRRPGLIRQLERMGYRQAGVVLQKELIHGRPQ